MKRQLKPEVLSAAIEALSSLAYSATSRIRRIGNVSSKRRAKARWARSVIAASKTSSPVSTVPSNVQYDTATTRSLFGATGQPWCQDEPRSAAVAVRTSQTKVGTTDAGLGVELGVELDVAVAAEVLDGVLSIVDDDVTSAVGLSAEPVVPVDDADEATPLGTVGPRSQPLNATSDTRATAAAAACPRDTVRPAARDPVMSVEVVPEDLGAARVAQLRHRLGLDLADPLAGHAVDLPDLVERLRLAVGEAEPHRDHSGLALGERVEHRMELLLEQREAHRVGRDLSLIH